MTLTAQLRRLKAKSDTPGRFATAPASAIGPANTAMPAISPNGRSRIGREQG
jgi:hypothetical protein